MDLRRAIGEYVTQGRELLERLRSPEERPTVTAVDLHMLRVQLFLLDHEAANLQELRRPPLPSEAAKGQGKRLPLPPNE
jgi:hypothetical protein